MLGSRLDAISSVEDYAKRAYEFRHPALAVTDHGRLSAIWENQIACRKYGIKPIIGVEMYIADELETFEAVEGKRTRTKNSHLILLASNKEGYQNLLKLNYLSMYDEKHFYYSPRTTIEELISNRDGIIVGTGCIANPIITKLRQGQIEEAEKNFNALLNIFGSRLYVEVQLNELNRKIDELANGQKTANDFMVELANKHGVPVVLTGDVHYLEKGQDKLQTLAIAIRDKTTIDNLTFEFESKELYYHDVKDYIDFNERFGYNYSKDDIVQWCDNSDFIASKCNYQIPEREKIYLPKMTDDDDKELINKGKIGLVKRLGISKYEEIPVEYRKRLERELEIIIRKGFSSYFLIVEDITQFSTREDIYGRIGRGSVGGSLLAYSLGIHNLDPIHYGLLFERFLSESRSPDIVIDYFCE
jgi:DNA polymerase-3 subunit alpha